MLSAVSDWVAADVAERGPLLPGLMPLVQLAALPPEPALPSCLSTSPEGRHVLHQIMHNTAAAQRGGAPGLAGAFGLGAALHSVTSDTAGARQLPAADVLMPMGVGRSAGWTQQPAVPQPPQQQQQQQQQQHKAGGVVSLSSTCTDVVACSDQGASTCSTSGRLGCPMAPAPRRRGYRPTRLLVAGRWHGASWLAFGIK